MKKLSIIVSADGHSKKAHPAKIHCLIGKLLDNSGGSPVQVICQDTFSRTIAHNLAADFRAAGIEINLEESTYSSIEELYTKLAGMKDDVVVIDGLRIAQDLANYATNQITGRANPGLKLETGQGVSISGREYAIL